MAKSHHERGWHRLFYTSAGDLDLSWFLVCVCIVLASFGFVTEAVKQDKISNAAWSFLAGAFISVLMAAIPINKARVIANAKSIGAFSSAVGSSGGNVWKDNERDPDWDSVAPDAKIEAGTRTVPSSQATRDLSPL